MPGSGVSQPDDPPKELIDLMVEDIESRGEKPRSAAEPTDSQKSARGNYEQQFRFPVILPNNDDGVARYNASKQDGEWEVKHLGTQRVP
jgi:hypothetical protein